MKRLLTAIVLALVALALLATTATAAQPVNWVKPGMVENPNVTKNLDLLLEQANDFDPVNAVNDGIYIASITDTYFQGGVEVGLEALLEAGRVYVNGIRVPADPALYYMNGMPAIWYRTWAHDWAWQAHDKLNKDTSDGVPAHTFEQARRAYILAVSGLRGMTTSIYALPGQTKAYQVNFSIKSAGQVEYKWVNWWAGTMVVLGVPVDATSYHTDGGPNNWETRSIRWANYDWTIRMGDTVLYWYDRTGWHMERCVPVTGLMTAPDTNNIEVNGVTASDALIVRYNMQAGSRPGQVVRAVNNLQLGDVPVTLWNTDTGHVVGISHGKYAKTALYAGLQYVNAQLAGKTIVASVDGTDVLTAEYWVTQAILDAWTSAYDNAKAVYYDWDSTWAQMDAATERLSVAFGTDSTKGMRSMKPGTQDLLPSVSADAAIVSVTGIGFVDTDGAKLSSIDIEYNVELDGSDVSLSKFEISDYGIFGTLDQTDPAHPPLHNLVPEIGSNPGVATKAYVKNKNHVIIEVNKAYQLGSVAKSYKMAMIAGVKQVGTINALTNIITPSTVEKKNYQEVAIEKVNKQTGAITYEYRLYADDGTYKINGTQDFKLFTKAAGTAFHATDCWEEANGTEVAVDLPYALYVPKNYDPDLKYALVLHIHDAGFMGDDPMIALTESQGPVNFASPAVQQIAKNQGLDGIIVVVPQIADALRSTRDDYSLSAAVPATWQLMDSLTKKYSIDMNHIYGEGQSMGGMQVGAMAAQRDNYFAAWWANGCQWGSNFNLDDPTYNGTPYFEAPQDGDPIWTVDADGNPVDYRNWYYLVSDDNVLINNCKSDVFSTTVWSEFKYLYQDLVGAEIPYAAWNPLTTSKTDQNAAFNALVAQPNDLGIYWAAFDGGNHMATWIYSHGVSAAYDWLLSQTRESEMARGKLDLNKPFEKADVQLQEPGRAIPGSTEYLVTGKSGAGTLDYNSALYKFAQTGITIKQPPGWLPLKAGAGASPINFPIAMFDPALPNLEGFNGVVADAPYARVLVLQENGVKVAICSLELVNIPTVSIIDCQNIVSAATGTPTANVWVHATHAITTPHYPGNADHSPDASETQAYLYYNAVHDAMVVAAQQAADSFQYALAGVGTGTCDVNMNRDVQFPDTKWYIGLGSTLTSNKTMTVVRLDSQYADPIGFFLSYGIKPTCIDNSGGTKPTDPTWTGVPIRQISPDVPGLACRLMEDEYGAPALFAMPAAGDQVPKKWCYYQIWDSVNNKAIWQDEGIPNGLAWTDELGTIMADDAIGIADAISCTGATREIGISQGSFDTPNKNGVGTTNIPVGAIRFGDTAFVGFKPELNYATEQQLWDASPYAHTLLLSFNNGDQRYMPHADAYTWVTGGSAEAQKSPYAAGSAESLRDYALGLLNGLL